jgi:hypothetical protein
LSTHVPVIFAAMSPGAAFCARVGAANIAAAIVPTAAALMISLMVQSSLIVSEE